MKCDKLNNYYNKLIKAKLVKVVKYSEYYDASYYTDYIIFSTKRGNTYKLIYPFNMHDLIKDKKIIEFLYENFYSE